LGHKSFGRVFRGKLQHDGIPEKLLESPSAIRIDIRRVAHGDAFLF
jgi:hypothetical protein